MVGGKVVAGGVPPRSLHEAVGGREQLEGVDAELYEMGAAGCEGGDTLEVGAACVRLDEGQDVAEGADADS